MLLVLVSGGGSALLPLPTNDITLTDKLAATGLLASHGATIHVCGIINRPSIDILVFAGAQHCTEAHLCGQGLRNAYIHVHFIKRSGGPAGSCSTPRPAYRGPGVVGCSGRPALSHCIWSHRPRWWMYTCMHAFLRLTSWPESTYAECVAILERLNVVSKVPPCVLTHLRQGTDLSFVCQNVHSVHMSRAGWTVARDAPRNRPGVSAGHEHSHRHQRHGPDSSMRHWCVLDCTSHHLITNLPNCSCVYGIQGDVSWINSVR